MDSQELLLRLKSDDTKALKEIFDVNYSKVFQTIQRIVNESDSSEDLAQEVFVRFWEKRNQLEILGEIGPYLRRMAINEALGFLRKNKKYSIEDIESHYHLSSELQTDAMQGYSELKHAISNALNFLPPKCRIVFSLSRFEGLSYKEIGDKMNISVKTVENQMGKALKIMRECLKDYLTVFIFFFNVLIGGGIMFCIINLRIAMQLFLNFQNCV